MPHQVAFNRRYTPLVVELKRRLAGATIQHIDCQFYRVGRTGSDFTTTAIHGIDTVRFLAGCDLRCWSFLSGRLWSSCLAVVGVLVPWLLLGSGHWRMRGSILVNSPHVLCCRWRIRWTAFSVL